LDLAARSKLGFGNFHSTDYFANHLEGEIEVSYHLNENWSFGLSFGGIIPLAGL